MGRKNCALKDIKTTCASISYTGKHLKSFCKLLTPRFNLILYGKIFSSTDLFIFKKSAEDPVEPVAPIHRGKGIELSE